MVVLGRSNNYDQATKGPHKEWMEEDPAVALANHFIDCRDECNRVCRKQFRLQEELE